MSKFDIKFFSVTKEGVKTTLACELSTLEGNSKRPASGLMTTPNVFHRIYPDACDEGITIVGKSHEVDFVMSRVDRDEEGDLRFYELVPTRESLRKVPEAAGTKVILFND